MTALNTTVRLVLGAAFAVALLAGCDKRPADQPPTPTTTPEAVTPTPPATPSTTPAPDAAAPAPAPGATTGTTPPPANPQGQ